MRARLFGLAALVIASLALSSSRADARPSPGWVIAPRPRWVLAAPAASARPVPIDDSLREYLLDDTQVRVAPDKVESFRHVKSRLRSAGQVEEGSQLELGFNPAHERLVIHHVHIVRDGHAVSALARRDVRVVQRERDLEHRIYDGTLTALIFLRDVRVGDVVDYAYSVEGSNPLLGGKYVTRFALADRTFTASWRHRIVLPVARTLTVKTHGLDLEPTVTADGRWREYLWQRHDVAPIEPEDGLPDWFDAEPWVDVSEFGSWAEVGALFDRLFPQHRRPSAALATQIAKLRARGGSDEDRLLEATRFVQDDIRYLGLELGLSGHKPFEPSVVLARRFGDCKDKAVLLVTLLGALGFDARPALVDTSRGRGLASVLPSPFAFNHAIVRVLIGGVSHFIDPTVSYQRGSLSARLPPGFERALIVAPDSKELVSIPRAVLAQPSLSMRETFVVDGAGAADLEVETTFRFDEADRLRARLASLGKKEIGRGYLNYYAESNPTVSQVGELGAVDDERGNALVLRERYHFGDFWRDSRHELEATSVNGRLSAPRIRLRRMPYALEFPLNVSHETIVRLPAPPDITPEKREISGDLVRFGFTAHVAGNDVVLRYNLQTLGDAVLPDQAARFFGAFDEIRGLTGYWLRRPHARNGGVQAWLTEPIGTPGLFWGGALALVALVVLGGLRATRRQRFTAQNRFASGEAAATAIKLGSEDEVHARLAGLKCACGARYQAGPQDENEPVTYDGRTLLVRTAHCPGCSKQRPIFFTIREA